MSDSIPFPPLLAGRLHCLERLNRLEEHRWIFLMVCVNERPGTVAGRYCISREGLKWRLQSAYRRLHSRGRAELGELAFREWMGPPLYERREAARRAKREREDEERRRARETRKAAGRMLCPWCGMPVYVLPGKRGRMVFCTRPCAIRWHWTYRREAMLANRSGWRGGK